MTKTSKCLTIAVTVFSVLFMGVAAVMSTARTDWKARAEVDFPKKKIAEQNDTLRALDDRIKEIDEQQTKAVAGIEADVQAIVAPNTGYEAQLEAQLAQVIDEAHAIAGQVEAEAKKVEAKQDEAKRLRDEVTRLKSQFDDLVAQKEDSLTNAKKLRDLLFQSKGVLERVKKRRDLLEADETKTYEPGPEKAS